MSFRRFFVVRLAWALFGAWFAATLIFLLFFVVPVSPERLVAGPQAPPDAVARTRDEWGFDEPVLEQYGAFLRRLVVDRSVGRSPATDEDSSTVVLHLFPQTLSVIAAAGIIALGLGVPLGLLLAKRRVPRNLTRFCICLTIGTGPIVLGIVLAYYAGFRLDVLPEGGYCFLRSTYTTDDGESCGGLVDWARSLVLPGLTLGLYFSAVYAWVISRIAPLGENLRKRKSLVIARMVGRDLGWALSALVLVELIFGIPGLGRVAVESLNGFDLVIVQAATLALFFLAIGFHCLVDLVVGALDKDLRAEWPISAIVVARS